MLPPAARSAAIGGLHALDGLQRSYAGVGGDVHDAVGVRDAVAGGEQDRDWGTAFVDEAARSVGERRDEPHFSTLVAGGRERVRIGLCFGGFERRVEPVDLPGVGVCASSRRRHRSRRGRRARRARCGAGAVRSAHRRLPRSAARARAPTRRTGTRAPPDASARPSRSRRRARRHAGPREHSDPCGGALVRSRIVWVERFARLIEQRKGASAFLLSPRGTLLAKLPGRGALSGGTGPSDPLIRAAMANGKGHLTAAGLDGVHRIYAFSTTGTDTRKHLVGIDEVEALGHMIAIFRSPFLRTRHVRPARYAARLVLR